VRRARVAGPGARVHGWPLRAPARLAPGARAAWGAAQTAFFGLVTSAVQTRLDLIELLPGCGGRFGGGPLFGRHRRGDGLAACMLPMAQVWRVGRLQSMRTIGQKAGSRITGRLHPLAVARLQGRRHERMPHDVSAGLRQLCHNHAVALRIQRPQAQAAGQRCVLSHRDVLAGPVLGHAGGCVLAVGDHHFVNPAVDLLVSPIGGRDKAVKARQVEQETNQAHAACPDFAADQMEAHHQPVYKGKSEAALQALCYITNGVSLLQTKRRHEYFTT